MEKDFLQKIGKNIKAERVRKGLSQEQLAELVGTSSRTVGLIENGVQQPKILLVVNLAKALGVDINEFLKI
ncbi:MAG: helix-turn-helix transcriptional regulator [Candidatus Gastranaerophilales bacterium]|nr:helix-turn-helix transcriptional regulator [Candidatus Gastranaerophilales bacterium]